MHSALIKEIKEDVKFGQLDKAINYAREKSGAIDDIRFGDSEDTCLLKIARTKPANLLTDIEKLLQIGVNPNTTNKYGFTPLLAISRAPGGGSFEKGTTAASDALKFAETLVKYGADVNQCDEQGMSPLSWAAWAGHVDLVDFLISKGANQDVDPRQKDQISPLHYAAISKRYDVLDVMVKKHGFDVNYFSNQTALHFVVQNENFTAAQKLIELGAQIDVQDAMTGRTARDMLYVKECENLIDVHDDMHTKKMRAAFERAQNIDKILAAEEMARVKELQKVIGGKPRNFTLKRRR